MTRWRAMLRTGRPRTRNPHDREMVRLALPALGALAAEPLYLLADTAIVGHLGTPQLAALGIAGVLLTTSFTLFNFLAYGTTAQVARLAGGGRATEAGAIAAQSLWLASAIGVLLLAAMVALAQPLVTLMGGHGETAGYAVQYLRIAAIGLPFALIALAGQGYLRGLADLRTPLRIVIAANALNVVLELLFVYGFEWGMRGSRPAPRSRRRAWAGRSRGCCCEGGREPGTAAGPIAARSRGWRT